MITLVLMILEAKFDKNFGDATKYTPMLDFIGAAATAIACTCECLWQQYENKQNYDIVDKYSCRILDSASKPSRMD